MIISPFLLLLLFQICSSRSSLNRDRVPQISESFRQKNYFRRTLKSKDSFRANLKALLDCEMFRATCLALSWRHCLRDKLHDKFHSVTYLVKAKIVARQVARAVAVRPTCLATILAVAGNIRPGSDAAPLVCRT